jgi:hypothetical protein
LASSFPQPTSGDVPEPVARVAALMSDFQAAWSLCGGWAVDAWLGCQTREHKDVDITVFEGALPGMLRFFDGWELLAHDAAEPDSTEQWSGRRLSLPAHIHARREDWDLDFQLSELEGAEWVLSRDPRVVLDLHSRSGPTMWGVFGLVPEALLFYKAQDRRPVDEADFVTLSPRLDAGQRDWLQNAISQFDVTHPWIEQLSREG